MAPVFLEAGERFQIVHAIREKPWKKIVGRYMTIEDGVREQIGYKLKEKKKFIGGVGYKEPKKVDLSIKKNLNRMKFYISQMIQSRH